MSRKALVSVALMCIPVIGESTDLSFYAGGALGQDVEIEAVEDVGAVSDDPSSKFFGGIGIGENLAVEMAYHDFGTTTCCGPGYADFGFERNGDGFSASALALWPINRFRVFARAGAVWWSVDGYDLTIAGRRPYSSDGADLVIGFGGDVLAFGGLRMRLEWERLEIDGKGADWVSIGVLWQF